MEDEARIDVDLNERATVHFMDPDAGAVASHVQGHARHDDHGDGHGTDFLVMFA